MQCRGALFRTAITAAVVVLAAPAVATAGAWNLPKGDGLVILKYEPVKASNRYNESGQSEPLMRQHTEEIVSLWGEYGLTDRITLMAKTDWQDSVDEYYDFQGRGLLEVGARVQVLKTDHSVLSVQMVYGHDGDGRNATWAEPGQGEHESEARVLFGRGFDFRYHSYFEAQLARRWRDGLPDETRWEMAFGVDLNPKWSVLTQVYAGKVDTAGQDGGAKWTKIETGIIRHMDDWSLQAGWRRTASGRRIVDGDGIVVALWRRF